MAIAPEQIGIGIRRYFTQPGVHPTTRVEWERREARIPNYKDGTDAFFQPDVEFPVTWSQNATNIVAQKYFRGTLGTDEREHSLRQVIDRVADTITAWGVRDGYFVDDREGAAFRNELKFILLAPARRVQLAGVVQHRREGRAAAGERVLHPRGRGHDGRDPQLVPRGRHDLQGRLRLRDQPLQHPLVVRAPRGRRHRERSGELHARRRRVGRHDQVAAARRVAPRRWSSSTSTTPTSRSSSGARRARSARHEPSRDAGFDMDLDGSDSHSIQYQNANNSVRVTDEFMQAVVDDDDWDLMAVTTGEPIKTVQGARADAPDLGGGVGVRRPRACSSTPRSTAGTPRPTRVASTGRNPCSEYMHIDNSACNLASINLLKYLDDDGNFDIEGYRAHRRGDVHRAGDPRRQRRLPDREDRGEQPQVPPARPRLRQPRRAAHGPGPALRLRRRSGVGGGDHRADDRSRLRHERPHRRAHGAVRRLRRERRRR